MDKSSPVEHPDLSITGHLSAFLIPGRAKTFKISMQVMGLPEFEPELVTKMIYFGCVGHFFVISHYFHISFVLKHFLPHGSEK